VLRADLSDRDRTGARSLASQIESGQVHLEAALVAKQDDGMIYRGHKVEARRGEYDCGKLSLDASPRTKDAFRKVAMRSEAVSDSIPPTLSTMLQAVPSAAFGGSGGSDATGAAAGGGGDADADDNALWWPMSGKIIASQCDAA